MTLREYFGDWFRIIYEQELFKVLDVLGKLYQSKLICPKQEDIFKIFNVCPYKHLKVVMLLQDPYPQKDVATGIALGNKVSTIDSDLSPSLQVIKEAVINYEVPRNGIMFDNSLETWANQGVLLLNSALTVEMNKVGSHAMLWRDFIVKLLKTLSEKNNGIIYVLFGEQAKTFKPYINSSTNIILEEKHPAYYARINQKMPSGLFETIDKLIKENYGTSIEWYKEF